VKRLGLFGGSFDPVHLGHLLIARAALEQLGLDRLYFIPAQQSPFKPGPCGLSGAQRARLLRLALAGWTQCEVTTEELERVGISYTADTVRAFGARFPDATLTWLIGSDQVALLPRWRDAAWLAERVVFAVAPRPGDDPGQLLGAPFQAVMLSSPLCAIASSDIRGRIRSRRPFEQFLPAAVGEAIRNYSLYL
jgi:nicotinate-nucleotide adenylyltransferase